MNILRVMMRVVAVLVLAAGVVLAGGNAAMAQGVAKQRYNPFALFADVTATGAKAICIAEGNCNANGQPNSNYYGHQDPVNKYMNYGWCSANTKYCPSCANNIAAANKFCLNRQVDGVKSAINNLQKIGVDPYDPANMALLITFVDAYNTSAWVAEGRRKNGTVYGGIQNTLKRIAGSGPYTFAQVVQARQQSCREVNCKDPRALVRTQIVYNTVSGGSIKLGDISGLDTNTPVGFADIKTTLIETVSFIKCWSCGIVEAVTRVADTVGEQVFNFIRVSLVTLLAAILGIYLVYHAMRVLMPFGPLASISGIFGQMTLVTGTTLFVIAMLGGMDYYWNNIYRPILSGSMETSQAVLRLSGANLKNNCVSAGSLPTSVVPMQAQLSDQMTCITESINETLSYGIQVGWAMIVAIGPQQKRQSFDLTKITTYIHGVKLIFLLISGIILMGIYIYASLGFLWVIIDIVYRWTFVSVISPLAIAAFSFNETRKFSVFATRSLLESFVALILVSIVAALSVLLIAQTGFDTRTTAGTLINQSPEEYIKLIAAADPKVRAPTFNTTLFYSLAMIGLMVGSLVYKMKDLASYLTSSALGGWAAQKGQQTMTAGLITAPLRQMYGLHQQR
jgi:hypothetical protein